METGTTRRPQPVTSLFIYISYPRRERILHIHQQLFQEKIWSTFGAGKRANQPQSPSTCLCFNCKGSGQSARSEPTIQMTPGCIDATSRNSCLKAEEASQSHEELTEEELESLLAKCRLQKEQTILAEANKGDVACLQFPQGGQRSTIGSIDEDQESEYHWVPLTNGWPCRKIPQFLDCNAVKVCGQTWSRLATLHAVSLSCQCTGIHSREPFLPAVWV